MIKFLQGLKREKQIGKNQLKEDRPAEIQGFEKIPEFRRTVFSYNFTMGLTDLIRGIAKHYLIRQQLPLPLLYPYQQPRRALL